MWLDSIHSAPSFGHPRQLAFCYAKWNAFRPYIRNPFIPSILEARRPNTGPNYRSFYKWNGFRDNRAGGFWDSNAERSGRGKFRSRNPVEEEEDDDDDDDDGTPWWSSVSSEEEYYSDDFEDGYQQSWGSIGVQKAFGTLTWILPAVLIPWLLGSPMALMMALVLPFAQTAVSTLFQQVWKTILKSFAPTPSKPKRKRKSASYRKNQNQTDSMYSDSFEAMSPEVNRKQSAAYNETQSEESSDVPPEARQKSSWADFDEYRDDGVSGGLSFGGWEDLDNSVKVPVKTVAQKKRSKVTRKIKREVPLFFRLLIALFPFLGFWGKLL